MEGIGRAAMEANVAWIVLRKARTLEDGDSQLDVLEKFEGTIVRGGFVSKRSTYSSVVIVFRSLRSAPAQKHESTPLAITSALVGPRSLLACIPDEEKREISLPSESY